MTKYVLDTDTLIFLLKQNAGVQAHLQAVGARNAGLSVMTVAEVLHGAYYSSNPGQSLQDTRTLIKQFTIIRLNETIADTFGRVKAELRRQGQILADFDLLIGATAITTQRMLVTNNTQHFQRLSAFGLQLTNWKS